jgi:hypothetical protein
MLLLNLEVCRLRILQAHVKFPSGG